jgi:hypothetical protein
MYSVASSAAEDTSQFRLEIKQHFPATALEV